MKKVGSNQNKLQHASEEDEDAKIMVLIRV